MGKIEKIKFVGVDDSNRAIFMSINHPKNHFGCTEKLFGCRASESEVLKNISEKDLCFFGSRFGCEPMGTIATNLKIIKSLKL